MTNAGLQHWCRLLLSLLDLEPPTREMPRLYLRLQFRMQRTYSKNGYEDWMGKKGVAYPTLWPPIEGGLYVVDNWRNVNSPRPAINIWDWVNILLILSVYRKPKRPIQSRTIEHPHSGKQQLSRNEKFVSDSAPAVDNLSHLQQHPQRSMLYSKISSGHTSLFPYSSKAKGTSQLVKGIYRIGGLGLWVSRQVRDQGRLRVL